MSWISRLFWDPIRKWIGAMGNRLVVTKAKPQGELVAPQIERALNWIWLVFLLGFVVIGLLALGRPEPARLQFFATSALAGLCALGAGGALGLLFGLPTSSGRVTVVAQNPAGGGAGGGSAGGAGSAASDEGWYRDNTSLEQIAQWLTTAIVALSLANFDGWVDRFDNLAKAVTCAMYAPVGAATRPETVSPVAPARTTGAPVRTPGNATPGAGPTLGATTGGAPAAGVPSCPASDGVPGGLLLAAYAIFGLIGGYLWSRRYLAGEFAGGRNEMLDRSRREVVVAAEERNIDRAQASGLVQTVSRNAPGAADAAASQLAAATQSAAAQQQDGLGVALVPAGSFAADPWKGQFGGRSSNAKAEMVASVSELTTRPGLYQIDIRIRGIDAEARSALAGKKVRIYLHPTFPDSIRTLTFDLTGELRLPLVAYGAFTVGAQLDDDTKLELDLAALPDVPEAFRMS